MADVRVALILLGIRSRPPKRLTPLAVSLDLPSIREWSPNPPYNIHRGSAIITSTMSAESIKTVAVLGAGTMGNGVAHVFARAGHTVILRDVEQSLALE